jgi:hypothetical protein
VNRKRGSFLHKTLFAHSLDLGDPISVHERASFLPNLCPPPLSGRIMGTRLLHSSHIGNYHGKVSI